MEENSAIRHGFLRKAEGIRMRTCQMLYPVESSTRRSVSMDGMWKFSLDWKQEGEGKDWKNGVPGEERIPVPASFQDFYTDKEIREYTGDVWYETDFFVPGEWQVRRLPSVSAARRTASAFM